VGIHDVRRRHEKSEEKPEPLPLAAVNFRPLTTVQEAQVVAFHRYPNLGSLSMKRAKLELQQTRSLLETTKQSFFS
jgi:hypothetical protein